MNFGQTYQDWQNSIGSQHHGMLSACFPPEDSQKVADDDDRQELGSCLGKSPGSASVAGAVPQWLLVALGGTPQAVSSPNVNLASHIPLSVHGLARDMDHIPIVSARDITSDKR